MKRMTMVALVALIVAVVMTGWSGTASASHVDTGLTCNYPLWASPPTTDRWTVTGTNVEVGVGVNRNIGSVGTELSLRNRTTGGAVNVLETRSAGGSGWQTSHWLHDANGTNRIIVFNQAAGNNVFSQWGYHNEFPGTQAAHWNPIVSDHFHSGGSFGGPQTGQSPCNGTGYLFDDGRLHMGLGTVPTSQGTALALTNQYSLRSRVNQAWPTWALEQALYLNKTVASNGNLRVFMHGTQGGVGYRDIIRPYQNTWSAPHAQSGSCTSAGCDFKYDDLDYAVFVWNIFGRDVGVLVDTEGSPAVHLDMVRQGIAGCSDPNNHACGSISLHNYQVVKNGFTASAGVTRNYGVDYRVGTIPQIGAMGYGV